MPTLVARIRVGWVVAALVVLRCVVATALGPGDAEALYAMYARHLQLGYLDHAPLLGWLLRGAEILGPSELGVVELIPHGLALRLVPIACWLLSLAATRDLADCLWPDNPDARHQSAIAFIVCPLFLVGGLAAAPDAPMSAAWLGALALAARAAGATKPRALPILGVGLLTGIAALSKYSGALLGIAFVGHLVGRAGANLRRSAWTWVSALVAILVGAAPLIWNATHDWASIRHRLSWSQADSGWSLRNAGALVGGQLLYLSPLVAIVCVATLVFSWRRRAQSPALRLVALATFVPMVPLVLLCLWSRVAEPHWLLPVWLAMPAVLPGALEPDATKRDWPLRPRFLAWAACTAVALVVLLHIHVLTPLTPRVLPAALYDPRFDLAHDLRGWPEVARRVEQRARRERLSIVLGLHWTTCAQLDLALRARRSPMLVGCLTPERDDYDYWVPELAARRDVLYLVDGRWTDDPNRRLPLPGQPARGSRLLDELTLERGGRVVRRFELWR